MNAEFWRAKRVFVTGHTGFKGGWLSLWLTHWGSRLTGYALDAPTEPSLFKQARVAEGMRSVRGDLRNLDALASAMREAQPEVVFHLAAQPLVRRSYADPVETYTTNVLGTVHVLEAVRRTPGVRAVVVVTSDKCYENQEWHWGYRESEPMGGFDPYSSSKGCAELVTSAYRRSFFNRDDYEKHKVAIASARAGNVIGGGDWAEDRLVVDAVRAFMKGQPPKIRNPDAVRPWQHVMEPLAGYLILAQRLIEGGRDFAEAWNFGPRDEDHETVGEVVSRLAGLWAQGAHWEQDRRLHPHEAGLLKLDCSKARARLGWKARWHLDEALRRTVEWYRASQSGADLLATTLDQIETYIAAA
jgi:CDP-glucose 4,6-dehydratase